MLSEQAGILTSCRAFLSSGSKLPLRDDNDGHSLQLTPVSDVKLGEGDTKELAMKIKASGTGRNHEVDGDVGGRHARCC